MLGILAVIIAAGVLALLWNLRSEEKASHAQQPYSATELDDTTQPSGSQAGPAKAVGSKPKIKSSDDGKDPMPLRPEDRNFELDRLLAREVPARIREAAIHCFDASGFSYKQLENSEEAIEFDYTLRMKAGVASVQNVKLTQGIDGNLDNCVIKAISGLTWQGSAPRDFITDMSDTISLLTFKKWGEPMPHELEEVPEDPQDDDF